MHRPAPRMELMDTGTSPEKRSQMVDGSDTLQSVNSSGCGWLAIAPCKTLLVPTGQVVDKLPYYSLTPLCSTMARSSHNSVG
jgi:hypothetical protein